MKILIIDNRPVFKTGIRQILKKKFEPLEFQEMETCAASAEADQDLPDLVILGQDDHYPQQDPQIIESIRKRYPGAGLIALYKSWSIESIRLYFEAGVDGYLFESTSPEEWIECAHKALARKKYVPRVVLENILNHYLYKDSVDLHKEIRLSNRQMEVARLLIQNMTISGIAESLGRKVSSISTVKARIFKKLNISSLVELKEALEAYQNGFPSRNKDDDIKVGSY